MGLLDRLKHGWNAFFGKGPPQENPQPQVISIPELYELGSGSFSRPDRMYYSRGQERTFITTIYTRIAMDVVSADFRHVKVDKEGRFVEEIDSELNRRLKYSANKDQTGRAFLQDIVMSMFDEGCIAVVPVDTDREPPVIDQETGEQKSPAKFDILSMRTGRIINWYPNYITTEVYDDRTGTKREIKVFKKNTAIIENPFYAIMNERNSIAQRLISKLNLLDVVDADSASGKLNLIIQLPYVIKTEARKAQAAERRADIQQQLSESKYGIAYTDGTEKITQLNRPAENNLMASITYYTSMLLSQLGLTDGVLNGSANEPTMLNYRNRIVNPTRTCIAEEMTRKYISEEAYANGERIMYFYDPFQFVAAEQMAELADKFTRNEIMSPNEVRQAIGLKPSKDPKADELRNRNLNEAEDQSNPLTPSAENNPVDIIKSSLKDDNAR